LVLGTRKSHSVLAGIGLLKILRHEVQFISHVNDCTDTVFRLWPLELSQHLQLDARITGYDISPEQFPAKEWLPPQVSLETLDIMGEELPKELENAFDVVHIRAFVCVVEAGDPRNLMAKLGKMLSMLPLSFFPSPLDSLSKISAPNLHVALHLELC